MAQKKNTICIDISLNSKTMMMTSDGEKGVGEKNWNLDFVWDWT